MRPPRLAQLAVVQPLAGCTGPLLVRDRQSGRRFVIKFGACAAHVAEELTADAAYRALGVPVPTTWRLVTPRGPAKLAAFVKGCPLVELEPDVRARALDRLADGFIADVVLAAWDVVGWHRLNVVVDAAGTPWRVDTGGSLRFGGRGRPRGSAWGEDPVEVWTLRDPVTNPSAAEAFGRLSEREIAGQVRAVEPRRGDLLAVLPADLRATVAARLDALARLADRWQRQGAA